MYETRRKTLSGYHRLEDPLLNKSTAFTLEERIQYRLLGLLPPRIETLEQQLLRTKLTFNQQEHHLQQHIFLRALQDRNEVLFYRFLMENIQATMPIIYTPTVGLACQQFSKIYRKPRGLYLSYKEKNHIDIILKEIKKFRDIKVIVITDGERILGLGDQGVGGLGIPIGKLSLYTLCGGIHPEHTLPIVIDVGTNNPELQQDPTYLGWQHDRLNGHDYFEFLDICIQSIKKIFPNVLLQFEDFAQFNAHRLLETYQDQLCCFNDDIQGTASVAAATILSAIFRSRGQLADQKICILGAGSAGCGIATLLVNILISQGIPRDQAYQSFYMIDKNGLLHDHMQDVQDFQRPWLKNYQALQTDFPNKPFITMDAVIDTIQPQILVGVSGQKGAFHETLVRKMGMYCQNPIILPLSNPNEKCEATPSDLLQWTQGRAIIATGSPYPDTQYQNHPQAIAQCNNSYIFPAMGLAVIAGKIKRIKPTLFMSAALELARLSNENASDLQQPLLPPIEKIRDVSQKIAAVIILQAIKEHLSPLNEQDLEAAIQQTFWTPQY